MRTTSPRKKKKTPQQVMEHELASLDGGGYVSLPITEATTNDASNSQMSGSDTCSTGNLPLEALLVGVSSS